MDDDLLGTLWLTGPVSTSGYAAHLLGFANLRLIKLQLVLLSAELILCGHQGCKVVVNFTGEISMLIETSL